MKNASPDIISLLFQTDTPPSPTGFFKENSPFSETAGSVKQREKGDAH
ncbi:MAG: hypothetical protein SO064_05205 [Prevotella sp.]|nr:hypothetical protein [Prevotella sp.]